MRKTNHVLLKMMLEGCFLISLVLFSAMEIAVADTNGNELNNSFQSASTYYMPIILNRFNSGISRNFRVVNAPYFINGNYSYSGSALFWFGQVNSIDSYADVRVGYNDFELIFSVNTIDRFLWYDVFPSIADLDNWDAVSLYISTDETPGLGLSSHETRWLAQLGGSSDRMAYQAVFSGDGVGWQNQDLPFTTEVRFQGGVNGNGDGKGWSINYRIPWSSLGYTTPPPQSSMFRLGVVLHDRDTSIGSAKHDMFWPEGFVTSIPDTWGGLHLGIPSYQPPGIQYDGVTTIRNGEQGAVVKDAHVGGAFDCGASVQYDFDLWGNKNYEADNPTQINIQNQWHIDDWPCFSKYFIAFPLDQIPENVEIVSATLTMYHFGNSDPSEAAPSKIHLFSVNELWNENTITWNNAPLSWTNISYLWVQPLLSFPGWPGIPLKWDVSLALQEAFNNGEPLNLALYSSDYERHSGKYFFSSDSNTDGSARPFVTVYWMNP